jgi:hypothetical protein
VPLSGGMVWGCVIGFSSSSLPDTWPVPHYSIFGSVFYQHVQTNFPRRMDAP